MHQKFYSIHWFYKNLKNSINPIVKMAANYAKIDRVSSVDAGFPQVQLVQNFCFTILLWNINNSKSVKKSKKKK